MGILALWVIEGCRKEYPENPRTFPFSEKRIEKK